jgi:hypothetical protein
VKHEAKDNTTADAGNCGHPGDGAPSGRCRCGCVGDRGRGLATSSRTLRCPISLVASLRDVVYHSPSGTGAGGGATVDHGKMENFVSACQAKAQQAFSAWFQLICQLRLIMTPTHSFILITLAIETQYKGFMVSTSSQGHEVGGNVQGCKGHRCEGGGRLHRTSTADHGHGGWLERSKRQDAGPE